MNQVVTYRVPPLWNGIRRWKSLVEQVPLPLPEAEPVRVVQVAFRAYEVIERPVRVRSHALARLGIATQCGVLLDSHGCSSLR